MTKPNTLFKLSVEDVDLIETSLRHVHGALSLELHRKTDSKDGGKESERESIQRRIQDLLGRLHDQKIFYRPKNKIYVSG